MDEMILYKNGYCLSTEKERLDIDSIHRFLSEEAYWSRNILKQKVVDAIRNSLCFGVYCGDIQIGFARVISDFSTVAYLGDLYIISGYRGKGLSKWLMQSIMGHPGLQDLRRWVLLTGDAHGLYRQFGWTALAQPVHWMEKHNKNVYPK